MKEFSLFIIGNKSLKIYNNKTIEFNRKPEKIRKII